MEREPREAAVSSAGAGHEPAATQEPVEGAGTGDGSKKIDPRVLAKWQYPVMVKPKNRRR